VKRFTVIDGCNAYYLRDNVTGRGDACLGDGVDQDFDLDLLFGGTGTEEFRQAWEDEANECVEEYLEAYFDLRRNKTMSEQKIAEKLSGLLEYDGVRVVFTVPKGEDYETLRDLIRNLVTVDKVDDDLAYEETQNALEAIARSDCDEAEDHSYGLEADIYTGDLIEWLAAGPWNYAWCDDEMEEGEFNSIIAIIGAGQSAAKRCVWHAVIGLVRELAEEE